MPVVIAFLAALVPLVGVPAGRNTIFIDDVKWCIVSLVVWATLIRLSRHVAVRSVVQWRHVPVCAFVVSLVLATSLALFPVFSVMPLVWYSSCIGVYVIGAAARTEHLTAIVRGLVVAGVLIGLVVIGATVVPAAPWVAVLCNHGAVSFSNRNDAALFLAIVVVFVLHALLHCSGKLKRGMFFAASAIVVSALVILASRVAWCAAGAGLVVTMWYAVKNAPQHAPKRIWFGGGGALALVVLVVVILVPGVRDRAVNAVHDPATVWRHRVIMWRVALDIVHDHFLVGVGPGAYEILQGKYQGRYLHAHDPSIPFNGLSITPHNDWLETAVNGGMGAVLALGWCVVGALRRGWRMLHTAPDALRQSAGMMLSVVVVELVAGFFHATVYHPVSGPLFFLSVGWLQGKAESVPAATRGRTISLAVTTALVACLVVAGTVLPVMSDWYVLRARLAHQRGRAAEALLLLDRACMLRPSYYRWYDAAGNICYAQGQFDLAVSAYLNALRCNPYYASTHNNLANTYQRLHDPHAAAQHYEQALAYNPRLGYAALNYGILLFDQGLYARAKEQFIDAARMLPNEPVLKDFLERMRQEEAVKSR